jgi:hypothetical protein
MDMLPERFSETQQMPAFKDICKMLGDQISPESKCLKVLERPRDTNSVYEAVENFLNEIAAGENLTAQELEGAEKIKQHAENLKVSQNLAEDAEELARLIKSLAISKVLKRYDLSSEEMENLMRLGKLQSSESFRHFGGCDSLLSVQIDAGATPDKAAINITVERETFDYLQQFSVEEKTRDNRGNIIPVIVPIGEYQIWRLTEALQANRHGKNPIMIKVFNEAGTELTNLFSLKERQ